MNGQIATQFWAYLSYKDLQLMFSGDLLKQLNTYQWANDEYIL